MLERIHLVIQIQKCGGGIQLTFSSIGMSSVSQNDTATSTFAAGPFLDPNCGIRPIVTLKAGLSYRRNSEGEICIN